MTGDRNKGHERHLIFLYELINDAYHRKYSKVITLIEKKYVERRVFAEEYYKAADGFIFRMDVTGLSYGEVFELAYEGLKKKDYKEYLLGLMIVASKLEGNQRYTYFDRDVMRLLITRIAEENKLKSFSLGNNTSNCLFVEDCSKYLPIGMDDMDMESYRAGALLCRYDKYKQLNEKVLEVEFNSAMKSGSVYHHIVDIDHFINRDDGKKPKEVWLHLIKLLTLHYGIEKAGWSQDLTEDLLKAFKGLEDSCDVEEFSELVIPHVSTLVKIAVKRTTVLKQEISVDELLQTLNFLLNINCLVEDGSLSEYIDVFSKMMKQMGIEREILMIYS